jgi:hypothetical protein
MLGNFFAGVADAGTTWANMMPRIAATTIKARVTKRFIKIPLNRKEKTPELLSRARYVAPHCWS